MIVNTTDILRKPALLNSKELLFIEDGRKHITKSVLMPVELFDKFREQIEDEMYLIKNSKALDNQSYKEFKDIDNMAGELTGD